MKFREKRPIKFVLEKAKIKPDGYLKSYKEHCYRWDDKSGFYWLSKENADEIDRLWKHRFNDEYLAKLGRNKPSTDKCKFARKEGCCGQPTCTVLGCDCSDMTNKECKTRLENKG